ncbi:HTTM domain-containing protein [Chondromyces crocatus]|uniref:HTTM-like domain-containing protein n=1 Tax=Chondromyces crocatus TaxID=52 RepID=A0A0K1E8N1_CHOCO|nr:HTTM domain-containing protein [Chondromyces crocatus]AKT37209.1 uncharacterized protein CMC5_013390 [Chondromyces crocatus]
MNADKESAAAIAGHPSEATPEPPPAPTSLGGRIREVLTPIYDPTGRRYSWWDLFRDSYFTLDRRTLGFTRILLGLYLIGDLFRRTWDWGDMYSVEGVLPNHVNLFRRGADNFTIFNAFSTNGELWVLWAIILATYVCVLVGFKTKLAQVLSLLWVASMNGRVLLIENGGYVVHNLLLLWTCFLPMGDRFSLDAMRASLRRSKERGAADLNDRSTIDDPDKPDRYVSIIGPVIILQLASIYFFNVVHKTGMAWKNGTAVHYVLYVDRMVTPAVAQVREYIPGWMILIMTRAALAFEASIPVCLLAPIGRVWARRLVIVMMNALHLAFGTTFVLGPFAWALCVFSTLMFQPEDWEIATQTMRREHRARVVRFDPASAGALGVCRLLMRMDRFGLLTFEEQPGLGGRLSVRTPDGKTVDGARALADMVAALPLGPVVAWMLRLPGVRGLVDALLGALDRWNAGAWLGLRVPEVASVAPPPSPLLRGRRKGVAALRELLIVVMWASAVNQAAVELWCINRRIRVPQHEPMRSLAHKFRFLQGWFMFSPNPVMDDGTIIVDAVTIDGRHINPFTGQEPDFDLKSVKSYGYNQIWSDYFNRMHLPANTGYRDAMKEYMFRYPERTGRPEDVIVSGDVYWVKDFNPKWGKTESYNQEREKLFSFVNPKAQAQSQGMTRPSSAPPAPEEPLMPRPAQDDASSGPVPAPEPPQTPFP